MMLLLATALALTAPPTSRPLETENLMSPPMTTRAASYQVGPPCCMIDPADPPTAPTQENPHLPPCCTAAVGPDIMPHCCTVSDHNIDDDHHSGDEQRAKRRSHPIAHPVALAPTKRLEAGAVAEAAPEPVGEATCCTAHPQPIAIAPANRSRIDIMAAMAALAFLAFVLAGIAARRARRRIARKALPPELLPATLMSEASIQRLRPVRPRYRESIDA